MCTLPYAHIYTAAAAKALQSCPTLCNPMDCSPPGSSVHGILQARVLEWVAISFSRGSSPPRDRTQVSCIEGRLFTLWTTREVPVYIYIQGLHPPQGWRSLVGYSPYYYHIKLIINKDLLYSVGNSTQYFITICMRKESRKEYVYMCVCVCTFF